MVLEGRRLRGRSTPDNVVRITPPSGWLALDLKEVWDYRELVYFFAWRDLKVRYKQTLIGAAWALLQPFVTMVVFTVVFGRILSVPSQGLPPAVFYYSGLVPWTYFANALGQVTNTMVDNQRVITKVYFPRLVLPLAAVLPGLVDLAISALLLVGVMLVYGLVPPVQAVLILPLIGLTALTALAAGLWLAALNAVYRDVRYAVPFLIQTWFFLSPVIYSSAMLPDALRPLYALNPMVAVIDGFRWALTGVDPAPDLGMAVSVFATMLLFAGGLIFFRHQEGVIADVV